MICVVRHAPVTVAGVCYGQCDVPTTLDAHAAAAEIGAQIAGLGLEVLETSPTARTRPVAEALGRHFGLLVRVEPRIAEISMGAWEGRTFLDIEASDGARYARWMERWQEEGPPGGERLADFVARIAAWRDEARGRKVLAVTHAGVIRALRALAAGAPYATVAGEPVEHLRVEKVRNLG